MPTWPPRSTRRFRRTSVPSAPTPRRSLTRPGRSPSSSTPPRLRRPTRPRRSTSKPVMGTTSSENEAPGDAATTAPLRPGAVATASPADALPTQASGLVLLGEVRGSGHRTPPSLVRRPDGQTIQLTRLLYLVLEAADGESTYAD